jgi:hypothetical protein
MAHTKSHLALVLAGLVALACVGNAVAQGGPAMPGPTGAPKITPPIALPPTTPPLGKPVVLDPTLTAPAPVPKGAREALQGRVAREVGSRTRLPQLCPVANSEVTRPFTAIVGRLEAIAPPPLAPKFGTDFYFLANCFEEVPGSLNVYVAPDPTQLDKNQRFVFSSPNPTTWSTQRVNFRVAALPYWSFEYEHPAVLVFEILRPNKSVAFRALITRPVFLQMQQGQVAPNPPSSN